MNNTRNNTWIIGIIAVLVVLLVAMCACMFGLVVGAGIGNARARLAIEDRVQRAPEVGPMEAPDLPLMPFGQVMPNIPGMPDMDQLMTMMHGAMVSEVVPGGPAEQAGIQPGDLIVAVDGDVITPDITLQHLVGAHAPGDEVTVTVIRMNQGDMRQQEVAVVLAANPDNDSIGFLGVLVAPFFPAEAPDGP